MKGLIDKYFALEKTGLKKKVNVPVLSDIMTVNILRPKMWNVLWRDEMDEAKWRDFDLARESLEWDIGRFLTAGEDNLENFKKNLLKKEIDYTVIPAGAEYINDLSGGMEVYLKTLSSNSRKNLLKKVRKVQHLSPQLKEFEGENRIETFLELFFKHHIDYWKSKGQPSYFENLNEQLFITEYAKNLEKSGQLVLKGLYFDDTLVHMAISMNAHPYEYGMMVTCTGEYQEYYPGIVDVYYLLEEVVNRGVRYYNTGPGNYQYKVQSATHCIPRYEIVITNKQSLKAKAYAHWLTHQLQKTEDELPSVKKTPVFFE